jgi:hypothetical protein
MQSVTPQLERKRLRLIERERLESTDGRDSKGRFVAGQFKGGPGNPLAGKVTKLRLAVLDALSPDDIRRVIKALVMEAEKGSIPACRELLDRTLGKPVEADLIERIEQLEKMLLERVEGRCT